MVDRRDADWLTCEQFARLAGIPLRTARHAIQRAAIGKPVKRWQIHVRSAHGRGGRAGERYEVALSSLSDELQDAFSGALEAAEPAPGRVGHVAPNQSDRIAFRWRVIEDALRFPRRSTERKAEIDRASLKWNVPVRTIQRWIPSWRRRVAT